MDAETLRECLCGGLDKSVIIATIDMLLPLAIMFPCII